MVYPPFFYYTICFLKSKVLIVTMYYGISIASPVQGEGDRGAVEGLFLRILTFAKATSALNNLSVTLR